MQKPTQQQIENFKRLAAIKDARTLDLKITLGFNSGAKHVLDIKFDCASSVIMSKFKEIKDFLERGKDRNGTQFKKYTWQDNEGNVHEFEINDGCSIDFYQMTINS